MLEEFVPLGEQSPNEIAGKLREIGDDEAIPATINRGLESLPLVVQRMMQHLGLQAARQLRIEAQGEREINQHEELQDLAERLETIIPHILRHRRAQQMLERGVRLPEVVKQRNPLGLAYALYAPLE
jgi:antitoxin component of MazEF toxin-antitoxin module